MKKKILDLAKTAQFNDIDEISAELRKIEKDILSIIDDENKNIPAKGEETFLQSIPKVINKTADFVGDEFMESLSDACSNCNY